MKKKLFLSGITVFTVLAMASCSKKVQNDVGGPANSLLKADAPSIGIAAVSNIDNGTIWKDTNNQEINAQGGNIIKVGSTYHWFGMQYPIWQAVNHYSSTDLKNWTKQPAPLTPGMSGIPFGATNWVGRPYVMWNPNTNNFVMAIEWGGGGTSRNRYGFLTADTIDGPWTYHADKLISNLPDINNVSQKLGDLGVYSDGNQAWLLYTFDKPQANYSQAILKLGPDFMTPLSPTAGNYVEFSGGTWESGVQEAAGVFKRGSIYYYFTSTCKGWLSSHTRYRTATSMAGPWTANAIVPTNPFNDFSFNTQHDFVIPIVGSSVTTYMYCGDRWGNMSSEVTGVGKYQWNPISFDNSAVPVPTINAPNYAANGGDWSIDVATGVWSATTGNTNVLQNPGFESDLSNWTITGNASVATIAAEVHSGAKAVKSYSTSAYTTTVQSNASTAYPAGTYTAKVWSRGDGTFNQRIFQVFVNGTPTNLTMSASTNWTQYTISNITVPSGASVKVGISLNAAAGTWTQFDDFELVKN